jgi:hypothetical protein
MAFRCDETSAESESSMAMATFFTASGLGRSGDRRGERTGQRGQQEAAAVHAGMVG